MSTLSNTLKHVPALGFWKSIWVFIVFSFLMILSSLLFGISSLFFNETAAQTVIADTISYSMLGNIVTLYIFFQLFCHSKHRVEAIQMTSLSKKQFLLICAALSGYAVFAIGSVNQLLNFIPVSDMWMDFFEAEGNLLTDAGWIGSLAFFIQVCILAPIFEEIFHRGFIISGLSKRYGVVGSVGISAVLFGVAHGNIHQFIVATIVGIFLGIAYYYTRNLWLVMIMHGLYNFIITYLSIFPETILEMVLLFISCSIVGGSIIFFTLHQLPWNEWKRERILETTKVIIEA